MSEYLDPRNLPRRAFQSVLPPDTYVTDEHGKVLAVHTDDDLYPVTEPGVAYWLCHEGERLWRVGGGAVQPGDILRHPQEIQLSLG